MPPVSTLMKIAEALGVTVSVLLEENRESGTVHTRGEAIQASKLIQTNIGYSFFAFAPELREKLMQPFLFHARKGEIQQHVFSHEGEEFIYMLEGEMKYKIGDIEYTLRPGDSVYFNSLEEHMLTPVTEEVRYLGMFTEHRIVSG
jgi:quercetin dioxygenase-like cupin family protein